MKINKYFKFWPLLLIFFALIPLCAPLVQKGFFVSDDGEWMVIRLASFHQTLTTGQFPVRFLWSLNHGFGYPVLNFLYPLPFYIGELFHIFGFGFVDSVKAVFLSGFVLSASFMYLWISSRFGKFAGLCAALFYSYFPYRVFDVYKRGSLGEATAFIFLPLIFLFIDKFADKKQTKFLALSALFFGLLIISHNVIAFIICPIILIYILVTSQFSIKKLILYFSLTFGLSAFFWIPAILELQYTKALQIAVANFNQYYLPWNDPQLVVPFLTVTAIGMSIFINKKIDKTVVLFIASTAISIFMATSLSNAVWQYSPFPKLVQFPWRFLALTAFSTSFLIGYIFHKLPIVAIVILGLTVFLSVSGLNVNRTFKSESEYSTNDDSTTVQNEYMPKWVKASPTKAPPFSLEIVAGSGHVLNNSEVELKTTSLIKVNKAYFPGIVLFENGNKINFNFEDSGYPQFELSPGRHQIKIIFEETDLRKISNAITVLSIILISYLIMKK